MLRTIGLLDGDADKQSAGYPPVGESGLRFGDMAGGD
jgi:hypothetical protein